jgi:hypothetical protein
MRTRVYEILQNDQMLRDLGWGADSFYASNAVDSPQHSRFMVLHWDPITPDAGQRVMTTNGLVVWAYDDSRDYALIDKALLRVRDLLADLGPTQTKSGWISDVTWTGDSTDLYDDGYGRITRNATFRLIASGR